jgi:3-isopropylmalate dehydrogenase
MPGKYRIAWLPGDGIGVEVCQAARRVLDAVEFPAEYLHGDIGWEFWCKEGDALPARTLELLNSTNCAFFGAITPSPREKPRASCPRPTGQATHLPQPHRAMRQQLDL